MSPILRASSTDHTGKGAGETDFVGARLVDALAEALTVAADTGGKANGSSLCRFAGGSSCGVEAVCIDLARMKASMASVFSLPLLSYNQPDFTLSCQNSLQVLCRLP